MKRCPFRIAHVVSRGVISSGRFSLVYMLLIASNLSPLVFESSGHRVKKWTISSSGSLHSGHLRSSPAACLQAEALRSERSTNILALVVAAFVRCGRPLHELRRPLVHCWSCQMVHRSVVFSHAFVRSSFHHMSLTVFLQYRFHTSLGHGCTSAKWRSIWYFCAMVLSWENQLYGLSSAVANCRRAIRCMGSLESSLHMFPNNESVLWCITASIGKLPMRYMASVATFSGSPCIWRRSFL